MEIEDNQSVSNNKDDISVLEFVKNYINNNYYDRYIEENLFNETNINDIKLDIYENLKTIYNSEDDNKDYMLFCIIEFILNESVILNKKILDLKNKVSNLQKLELPEQRSQAWFDLRKNVLTASSLASALGECHFTTRDELIYDKSSTVEKPYTSNPITEWGVKYEEIATKFYELINNVKILEFGLIPHPKFKIFGASPDGICSNDSPKEFIGRMLEIKVPPKRKFTKTVPSHYGYQMQGQLECCDLEECDFLQVKIEEYENKDDYINDKYIYNGILKEGYNSDNYPKGCTLTYQKKDSLSYSYLYPELCLTYENYKKWINDNRSKIESEGHLFIEAKWWKIVRYECTLVKRDRLWWANNMEKIYDFWEEVKYYRNNDRTPLEQRIKDKKKNNKRKNNELNIDDLNTCLINT